MKETEQPIGVTRSEKLTVSIIAVGAAAILFLRIADPTLWIDEVMTYDIATATLSDHLRMVYEIYDHPPLFFHLLWLLGRVSHSPIWLSAFPALLTLLAGGMMGMAVWRSEPRMHQTRSLAFFLVLFALSPAIHYQAWNLRHYGLFLFLGVSYVVAWLEILKGNARFHLFAAVLAGLGLLTHHFMLFVIIVAELIGGMILWKNRPSELLHHAPRRIALFLPFAALWLFVAWQQFPGSGGERIATILNNTGFPALAELTAQFHGLPGVLNPPVWHYYSALALGIILTALTVLRMQKSGTDLLWLSVAIVPVLLLFFLSFVQPALAPRFLLPSGTLLLAAHARTLAALGRTGIVIMGLATLVLLSGLRVHFTYPQHHPPYAEAIPAILLTVQQNEVLVLPPGSAFDVYRYYADQNDIPLPDIISFSLPIVDEEAYLRELQELPERLKSYRRAWVVYELHRFWDPENRVQDFFESNWIVGPYQPLWETKWVATYYDNPEYGKAPE